MNTDGNLAALNAHQREIDKEDMTRQVIEAKAAKLANDIVFSGKAIIGTYIDKSLEVLSLCEAIEMLCISLNEEANILVSKALCGQEFNKGALESWIADMLVDDYQDRIVLLITEDYENDKCP